MAETSGIDLLLTTPRDALWLFAPYKSKSAQTKAEPAPIEGAGTISTQPQEPEAILAPGPAAKHSQA